MDRNLNSKFLIDDPVLNEAGLAISIVEAASNYTHSILDLLDEKLIDSGALRISEMIELANLSSVIGNLLGTGIAKYSNGIFERNGPHKYPDLISKVPLSKDLEIKVALETNKPKGHLAKEGYYLICRYVLTDGDGVLNVKRRGNMVSIWEIRFGYLDVTHFNLSNTLGDSGKTAVVNSLGMSALKVIYFDLDKCPLSKSGSLYKAFEMRFK